jgi:ABC-type transport system substrate-binding protein
MAKWSLTSVRLLAVMIAVGFLFSVIPMMTGKPVVETVAAADEGYVRVGWVSEIVNWNPLMGEMVEDFVASGLIYSALFTYDEDWGGPVNDLATGYYQVQHANGSMSTFVNITHNAYFRSLSDLDSTDMQLTAEDVAYTFNLIKSVEGYTYDWYLQDIDVAGVHNASGVSGGFLDQIELYTNYTMGILMDMIVGTPVLPMDIWSEYTNPFTGMKPEDLVGSGPFVYESQLKGGWYKFKTAPNYHGAADYDDDRTIDINGIIYTIYGDMVPLCIAINEGLEDCGAITGYLNAFDETLGGPDANVRVTKAAVQEMGICDIAINALPQSFIDHEGGAYGGGDPALRDPYVRQAIAMTLDRDYIVDELLLGLATKADSVVQPGYWHNDIDVLPFDPEGARDLLEAHGWSADSDRDGYLEATASAIAVQEGWVSEGHELSGIRCQAPDTDGSYGSIAYAWKEDAAVAGIEFLSSIESEMTMINKAWYQCDYDIWVWHWGWGPEPISGSLSVWLTELIKEGGDNCEMPMGEWWYGWDNYTEAPTTWTGRGETIEFELTGPYSSFDQNMSIAMRTVDKAERKAIIDELQQVVYDSYTEIPPYYDLGLYGYSDNKFTGWGDWEAHTGLNVASGLLWLWFDLEILENRAPIYDTPPDQFYTAYAGMEETFTIGVSDAEGDPITVEFSFGDGETKTVVVDGDTTTERTVSVTHTYSSVGELTMYINLTDDWPERIPDSRVATVEVQGEINLSPLITGYSYDLDPPVYTGTPVEWTATATDAESDTYGLKFTWDWDDGTFTVDDKGTVPDGTEVTSTVTHTWTMPRDYDVVVNVYDMTGNEANPERNVSVTISYEVIENDEPAAPAIQAMNGIVGVSVSCRASSSDPDPDTLTFTWEWDDGTYTVQELTPASQGDTVTSSVTHTWDAEGTYPVTVYVDDGEGHNVSASRNAVISAIDVNVAPGSIGWEIYPTPVYADLETTFNISASDANSDPLTFTLDFGDDSDPVVLTTDGGTSDYQYCETTHTYVADGAYTVTVNVSDGELSDETTFTVTVALPPTNGPPSMLLQDEYSFVYGTPGSLKPVSLSDPDGDDLTVWYDWGDGTPMTEGDPENNYSATRTMARGTT